MVKKNNPLIKNQGICDPHIFVFDGKAYLYASHDITLENTSWYMENWHIYSSDDLINWKLEDVIYPQDTFVGKSDRCWAVDCVYRNGKYYFYFCIENRFIGVLVSDRPNGGFKDVLGKPLIDGNTSSLSHEYDQTVFIDDDGQAYIVYGLNEGKGYAMAKLNEDMISLDGDAWILPVVGVPYYDDKPFLFKRDELYYLTFGPSICISDKVTGPFVYKDSNGAGIDHGSYFNFKGQDFYAHGCSNRSGYYRDSVLSYAHFLGDGRILTDPMVVEFGVGTYDTSWYHIPMTWFMEGERVGKSLNEWKRLMLEFTHNSFVRFPNICNMPKEPKLYLFGVNGSDSDVLIEIYDNNKSAKIGELIWEKADCWKTYRYCWKSVQLRDMLEISDISFRVKRYRDDTMVDDNSKILMLEWMHFE